LTAATRTDDLALEALSGAGQWLKRWSDWILGIGVLGLVLTLIAPISPWFLDILLTINIAGSLLLLLVVLSTRSSPELSVFPTLLLFATLFRLGLNVASTRLILSGGDAGNVIKAFGTYMAGSNLTVGFVLFLILVVIQFVVITKGSSRVSEVTARFVLDAMPGKQMAIDADLNSGLIDADEARARRAKISSEAEFYGAMDGATKFVRGDAVAGLIITASTWSAASPSPCWGASRSARPASTLLAPVHRRRPREPDPRAARVDRRGGARDQGLGRPRALASTSWRRSAAGPVPP
jgi:flagellar biosynthesis component FlhA